MYSVVMATFNNRSTIIDSLDSICPQLTSGDELLIVNDCSTDNTLELLVQYRNYIAPVFIFRIVTNPFNLGLASSLNIAIQLSTQPLIVRMDADDLCFPNRLITQKSILDSNPHIDILSNAFIPFSSNSELENCSTLNFNYLPISNSAYHLSKISNISLAFQNLLVHPATIICSYVFNEIMYDCSYIKSQDYKCWLDAICRGYVIYSTSDPIIFYRTLPDSEKHFSQILHSIRARLSHLNFQSPVFSVFLFGILIDSLQMIRVIFKK